MFVVDVDKDEIREFIQNPEFRVMVVNMTSNLISQIEEMKTIFENPDDAAMHYANKSLQSVIKAGYGKDSDVYKKVVSQLVEPFTLVKVLIEIEGDKSTGLFGESLDIPYVKRYIDGILEEFTL